MIRQFARFIAPFALFVLPAFANAGPGSAATSFSVPPANVAKAVAAFDAWSKSAAASQFKGRFLLSQVLADGTDPATHVFVAIYNSAADYDVYQQAAMNDPARAALIEALSGAENSFTGRTSLIRSWGDVNETDTVWQGFYFDVTDPAGLNAAIDAWLASPRGKSFPGQAHLSAITSGGIDAPAGMFAVGWSSVAEMEAWYDASAGHADEQAFVAAIGKTTKPRGSDLVRVIKSWGTLPPPPAAR